MSTEKSILPVSKKIELKLPDTWINRITQAAKVMGKTVQEVEDILKTPPYSIQEQPMGLELLSDEEAIPFGDFRKLFCEMNGVSLPQLRIGMKYLRGPKNSDKAENIDPDIFELQSKYGIKTQIEDLYIDQLLPYYNPRKKNIVHEVLNKKYGKYGKFIAFKPDSEEVAIEETINYVTDLEAGFPSENSIEIDGELVSLFAVGEIPFEMLEEDPFAHNVPLKRGRSTVNRINWMDISQELRQFWRIVWDREEIVINTPKDRIDVMQLMKKPIEELKRIFPEAYLSFKTMKKSKTLPNLVISIQEVKPVKNNPFGIYSNRSY